MWQQLWALISNDRGQVPDGQSSDPAPADVSQPGEITDRGAEDESWGVRTAYDTNSDPDPTPANSEPEPTQVAQEQTQAPAEDDSFQSELNLDPSTFSPENREIFKRMQAAHTKRMQKIKGFEGHLQNMERFYNDRDFAEQTLRAWAQKNGYQLSPFNNNQPAAPKAPAGTNPLQAKVLEALKAKLPPETQWMADGQAAAIVDVMQEILSPVLNEFQGYKTEKEQNEWKALEQQYDEAEGKLGEKFPGWEAHESEMTEILNFMKNDKAYTHPKFGTKHELLYRLATGQAAAVKEVTTRVQQAGKNKTITSTQPRRANGQFATIEQEVAAVPDRNDAFAKAAQFALSQAKGRRR